MNFFEYLLKGKDIVAVLPTGFSKSLLFQLLPDFLPVKTDNNIVFGHSTFFLFTRVCEEHLVLCSKKEL